MQYELTGARPVVFAASNYVRHVTFITGIIFGKVQLFGNIVHYKSGSDVSESGSIVGDLGLLSSSSCRVSSALTRLVALKKRIAEMDLALSAMLSGPGHGQVVADIQFACSFIPSIDIMGLFNLDGLDAFLESQLGAVALCRNQEQFAELDPKVQVLEASSDGQAALKCIGGEFQKALREAGTWSVIRNALIFLEELRQEGATDAEASVLHCLIEGIMVTSETEFMQSPYDNMLEEMADVGFGNLIPANLSEPVKEVMDALGDCEVQLGAWRKAATKRI